jgi:hypothetical protein
MLTKRQAPQDYDNQKCKKVKTAKTSLLFIFSGAKLLQCATVEQALEIVLICIQTPLSNCLVDNVDAAPEYFLPPQKFREFGKSICNSFNIPFCAPGARETLHYGPTGNNCCVFG